LLQRLFHNSPPLTISIDMLSSNRQNAFGQRRKACSEITNLKSG
jgi:hypothetical protein